MPIIDVHAHLGDILYPQGGELINKTNLPMPKHFNILAFSEWSLYQSFGLGEFPYNLLSKQVINAERARNAASTLENMQQSLEEANIDYTTCLPIAPHVTFDDILQAQKLDKRIIPFTSIDFTLGDRACAKVEQDMGKGAMGLKLHPIIQKRSLRDPVVHEVVEKFANWNKPVLTHSGISEYYLGEEQALNTPENGAIHDSEQLVKAHPRVKFIIGHAGLHQIDEVISRLRGLDNVWVDTSFQPPKNIRRLMDAFGSDRVMFASDWPYGFRLPAIKAVNVACKGDKQLEEKLFYHNAKDLLG